MLDNETIEKKLITAYTNFRNEEYDHALDLLQVIEEADGTKDNWELKVTAGMSLFFLNRMDEARIYFEKVIASNDVSNGDLAQWFLAGCFLSNREYEQEAIRIYQEIEDNSGHDYHEKSIKVLKKLKH